MDAKQRVVSFVNARRNSDGGYCFVTNGDEKDIESDLDSTFFAVGILTQLGEKIAEKEKTIEYVANNNKNGNYESIRCAYHTLKILRMFNLPAYIPDKYFPDIKMYLKGGYLSIGMWDNYTISDSSYLPMYYAARILRILEDESNDILLMPDDIEWAIPKKKEEMELMGLTATYHLVSALKASKVEIEGEFKEMVIEKLKRNMCVDGGFTKGNNYPPYLESTYFGIKTAEMIDYKLDGDFMKKTKRFVAMLQNKDGGFRRALPIGISTLENTYFATKILF